MRELSGAWRTRLLALAMLLVASRAASSPALALVYQLEGDVTWRGARDAPVPLRMFARLGRGAHLRLAAGAHVALAFADGQRVRLTGPGEARLAAPGRLSGTCHVTSLPSVPPLPPLGALAQDEQVGRRSAAVRVRRGAIGGLYPDAPLRALANRTTLEFDAAEGAGAYRVELRAHDGELRLSRVTSDTKVDLPEGLLRPDSSYLWSVETVETANVPARGEARFATLGVQSERALLRLRAALEAQDGDDQALGAALDVSLGLRAAPTATQAGGCLLLAPGLDVRRVEADSAAWSAGLRAGDRVLSWCRPEPGGRNCARAEVIETPLAWLDAEIVQVPRGGVRVEIQRAGRSSSLELLPTNQGATLRPICVGALAADCARALEAEDQGDAAAAARALAQAAMRAAQARECGELASWLHAERGRLAAATGDWEAVDPAFASALAAVGESGDEPRQALVLRLRADALIQRGDFDGARAALDDALARAERSDPDGLLSARLLSRLGDLELRRDRVIEAERLLRRAYALAQRLAPGSGSEAAFANNLALAVMDRGDLEGAQRLIERGVAIRERWTPRGVAMVPILSTQGTLLFTRGDLAGAEDAYLKALGRLGTAHAESLEAAKLLHNLGRLAYMRGDDEGALGYLRRAAGLQRSLGDAELERDTELSLADALQRQGQFAAAEQLYASAFERGVALSAAGSKTSWTLLGLAESRLAQGHVLEAEAGLRQALSAQLALGTGTLAEGCMRAALGYVLFVQGRDGEARAELERAVGLLTPLDAPTLVDAHHALALLHARQGDPHRATTAFARAIEQLEGHQGNLGGPEESRWRLRSSLGDLPFAAARHALAQGDVAGAWSLVERAQGLGLRRLLAARDLRLARQISPEDYRERRRLAGAIDATREQLAALRPLEGVAQREALLAELQTLRGTRARLDAAWLRAVARLAPAAPLDVAAARAALAPGTIALQYAVGERESLLFVLGSDRDGSRGAVRVQRLPIGRAALAAEVDAFLALVARPDSDLAALRMRGARLGRLLLGPAKPALGRATSLLIAADGPLHFLPFAALVHDGRYLVEGHALHFTTGLGVYRQLGLAHADEPRPTGVLVVAAPEPAIGGAAGGGAPETQVRAALAARGPLGPLPFARREALALQALWPDSTLLLGEQATEAEVKRLLPQARLVHLAVHGLLDERRPLDSGLLLAAPGPRAATEANGLLQAWEVFEDLHLDADLVTLSACQTARGRADSGEGVLGLTRAFLFAGARAVMSSLWAVGDASTADLMPRFYAHLRAGLSKDAALQRAQLELLRDPELGFVHPYHWAGFELFGDAR